jgi:type II secretory pathway pseudopilin PulG
MNNHLLFRSRVPRHRQGLSVLEVTIALLLLGVAVSGLAQLITAASAQRRMIDARQLALVEVANQAERVALWTAAETTPDRLAKLAPSEELLAAVPTARVSARLLATGEPAENADAENSAESLAAPLRIRIEVTWDDTAGRTVSPLGVTIWKPAQQEGPP